MHAVSDDNTFACQQPARGRTSAQARPVCRERLCWPRTSNTLMISTFSTSHLAWRKARTVHSSGGGSGTRSIDPSSARVAPRLEMAPSKDMDSQPGRLTSLWVVLDPKSRNRQRTLHQPHMELYWHTHTQVQELTFSVQTETPAHPNSCPELRGALTLRLGCPRPLLHRPLARSGATRAYGAAPRRQQCGCQRE